MFRINLFMKDKELANKTIDRIFSDMNITEGYIRKNGVWNIGVETPYFKIVRCAVNDSSRGVKGHISILENGLIFEEDYQDAIHNIVTRSSTYNIASWFYKNGFTDKSDLVQRYKDLTWRNTFTHTDDFEIIYEMIRIEERKYYYEL